VRGWPVGGLRFDPVLVVRGLAVDTERGNLLQLNRFGYVKRAMHGTHPVDFAALRRDYQHTAVDLSSPRFPFLNTLFSLSEGCMYAQLVDLLDAGALGPAPLGYRELWSHVRDSVDATHTEGELKAEIMADPARFVEADPETALALLDQHHAGKRLLLITNSEWSYTAAMMSHAFDRFLPEGMSWRQLFALTVCAARKPEFFESRAPLLRVVSEEGLLAPVTGALEPGGCYFGGNAALVERHLGVSGDEILYFGDHMFGDVHVTKRALRWRTGLVVRELEDELAAVERLREVSEQLGALMRHKEQTEWQACQLRLMLQRRKLGYGPQPGEPNEVITRRLGELRAELVALDERIGPIAIAASRAHNPHWGLLMRAGNDKSQLARQIERYADVYTSRVSNLSYATPFAFLRAPRGSLPHDPAPTMARVEPAADAD
jgi:HAD superfamily 5'-nucleotidase-like hydrolase